MKEPDHSKTVVDEYKNKSELFIFIVFSVSCFAIIAHKILDFVIISANHYSTYPGENVVFDYISGFLWAAALGVSIFFWPVQLPHKKALILIWIIKSIVTLVLMLGFEYVYAFDADGYFHNAIAPDFVWKGIDFCSGTYMTRQITWLCLKIVPGSYYAAKVSFSMFSFIGIYLIYRAAVIFIRYEDIRILYILALFPGIVLWSSILGKDPITLFGFSCYIYGVIAYYCLKQLRYLVTLTLGILIVSIIRIWVAPIMVIPLLVFIIVGKSSILWKAGLMIIFIIVFLFALSKIRFMWNISVVEDLYSFRSSVVDENIGGSSNESQEITCFNDSIKVLPFALFSALFRPLPMEVPNFFGSVQGLENLILLILLVRAVLRIRWKELKEPLVLWAILLILSWATIYGLVIYNLGTLVRYKLQILPILLGLLLYLGRRRTERKRSIQLC